MLQNTTPSQSQLWHPSFCTCSGGICLPASLHPLMVMGRPAAAALTRPIHPYIGGVGPRRGEPPNSRFSAMAVLRSVGANVASLIGGSGLRRVAVGWARLAYLFEANHTTPETREWLPESWDPSYHRFGPVHNRHRGGQSGRRGPYSAVTLSQKA